MCLSCASHTDELPLVRQSLYGRDVFAAGFHFRVNYELHRKKVHSVNNDVRFSCGICGKDFMAQGLLRRHQATVSTVPRDSCDVIKRR